MSKLNDIFNRQRQLMDKYHEIEEANGLLLSPDIPVGLDDRFGQARLKDLAWRVTEELGEAIDGRDRISDEDYHEEIADVLHFLVELSILSGISPEDLRNKRFPDEDILEGLFHFASHQNMIELSGSGEYRAAVFTMLLGRIIRELAMACNTLKNRPWSRSFRLTDRHEFYRRMRNVWEGFILLCHYSGLEAHSLYDGYFGKAKINQGRQEGGY